MVWWWFFNWEEKRAFRARILAPKADLGKAKPASGLSISLMYPNQREDVSPNA